MMMVGVDADLERVAKAGCPQVCLSVGVELISGAVVGGEVAVLGLAGKY